MSLELNRKKLELMRVQVARQEQEFKILEREEEISRLKSAIEIQIATEEKLLVTIQELQQQK